MNFTKLIYDHELLMVKKIWIGLAFFAAAMGLSLPVQGQDYPSKPIKIVSPYAPGGGTDLALRILSDRLQKKWGQPAVVEYRPGAGGNIGAELVFRSPPDGYTLLLTPPPPLVINKHLYKKLSFDPGAFVPVSLISESPNVLLVRTGLPIDSLQQLINFAKENPGRLNYASPGDGSTPHLTAELFKSMTAVKLTHIPFNGTGPAIVALLGEHVDMMFSEISAAIPHIRAGKVRALAVSSEKRSPSLPDVPTVSEVLPGFVSMTSGNLVAPPLTPPAIVNKLSAAIAEIMREPEIAKRFLELSAVAVGSTPAEHALVLKQDSDRWEKVIRLTGTRMD